MAIYTGVDQFIERSRQAASLPALQELLEGAALEMGFDFYALIQHVDVRRSNNRETVWLENYPDAWAEAFVARGLYANDPILVASQKTSIGFQWSEIGRLISLTSH